MTHLTKFSKPDKISSLLLAPTLSKDLRGQVVQWCEEYGYSYKKLSELVGCSAGTISNILQYQPTSVIGQNSFHRFLNPGNLRNPLKTIKNQLKTPKHWNSETYVSFIGNLLPK